MEGDDTFTSHYQHEYKFVRLLGQGGFGIVFESECKEDGLKYAIKRIPLQQKREMEGFLKEVEVMEELDGHPNIVKYCDFWVEKPPLGWQERQDELLGIFAHSAAPSTCYSFSSSGISGSSFPVSSNDSDNDIVFKEASVDIVYGYIKMELCRESLRDWLKHKRKLDTREEKAQVLKTFLNICAGLNHIHEKGIIHRDLTPANIFCCDDGNVRIGDFGLAKRRSDDLTYKKSILRDTEDVGTSMYRSPEQLNMKPYDHKIDIYALGLILFELLVPFLAKTDMEYAIKYGEVMSAARLFQFPPEFKMAQERPLVEWLLSLDPKKRPEVAEVVIRLRELLVAPGMKEALNCGLLYDYIESLAMKMKVQQTMEVSSLFKGVNAAEMGFAAVKDEKSKNCCCRANKNGL